MGLLHENQMVGTGNDEYVVTEFLAKERIMGQGTSPDSLKLMQKQMSDMRLKGYELVSHTTILGKKGSFFFGSAVYIHDFIWRKQF